MMATNTQILSLMRYFVWTGIMRDLLLGSLDRDEKINEGDPGVTTFALMSYWFGSLYVVVEGWQELQLSEARIDQLLSDTDKVQKLKWYRNGAFHYQDEVYHEKFLRLMREEQQAADWVRDLHVAFEQFFSRWAAEAGYLNDEVLKGYEVWKQKHPAARSGPP